MKKLFHFFLFRKSLLISIAAIIIVALLNACDKEDDKISIPPPNEGVEIPVTPPPSPGLPENKFSVDLSEVNRQQVTIVAQETSPEEICTTEKVTWKPGSDETITIDPQTDVIYEGSVLNASSLQDGKYTPVTGKRKPIQLSISIPSLGTISSIVENPSLSSVREAKKSILTSKSSGMQPAQLSINSHAVYSKEHLSLLFKGKYSSSFAKLEAGYSFNDETIKSRYILDVTQVYYSIDVDYPGKNGFFEGEAQNAGGYSPAYISSMKYGRKVMIFIESKRNLNDQQANLQAEFSALLASGSFSANAESKKLLEEKSVKILVIGGNPESPFGLIQAIADQKSLFDILKKDAVWSLNNQGVPLAYTVRHCVDGSVFTLTQYGEYTARKCQTKPAIEWEFTPADLVNLCPQHIAGDGDFALNGPKVEFVFKLDIKGKNIIANIFAKWTETKSDWTQGVYNQEHIIGQVPDGYIALGISSKFTNYTSWYEDRTYEVDGWIYHQDHSLVKSLSVTGISPLNDDMNCSKNGSTRIHRIQFHPIKVSMRKIQ